MAETDHDRALKRRFKDLRERLGLTQRKVGADLGVHYTTVARWERDPERGVSLEVPRYAMFYIERMDDDATGRATTRCP